MIEWTAEADALLIKLWGEGCTLGAIADGLRAAGYPVSRNAVSGRRHRLSRSAFVPRQTLVRLEPKRRARPRVKTVMARKPKHSVGVQYMDNTGCKALLDNRGDWGLPMVCGEPKVPSHVYCEAHCKMFYHPHQEKRSTNGKASQSPGSRNFRQGRA